MEKEELVIGKPVAVAGVTLIPVARVSLNYWRRKSSFSYYGVKQLSMVVVVSPLMTKALSVTGEEIPLDRVIREVPGIEEVLAEI